MVDTKRDAYLSLRASREVVRRLDALKKDPGIRALPVFELKAPTRSAIARLCILRGLDQLERETKRPRRSSPPPPIADAAALPPPEPPPQKKTTRKKKAKSGPGSWRFNVRTPTAAELADPDLALLIDGEGWPCDYALDMLRERKGK